MTDTKHTKPITPEEPFDVGEEFNRLHDCQKTDKPQEPPTKAWRQRKIGSSIERNEKTERIIWDKRVHPIVEKHDLRRKSELFQYRFFPDPKEIDEQGMYLMLRKTMVLCWKVGIPENGIPNNEPNDLFEGPNDFASKVMDELHSAEPGQTKISVNGGRDIDLKVVFRSFLDDIFNEQTLPYFLELLREEEDPIASAEVADEYGINDHKQLRLINSRKLTPYKRIPGSPSPNRMVGRQKIPQYAPFPFDKICNLSLKDIPGLYYGRYEIEALAKPEGHAKDESITPNDSKKSNTKDGVYSMLDNAIEDYFDKTQNPPKDLYTLDKEIWRHEPVKVAMKLIGTLNIKSLKSGLRQRELGKRLPKLGGGRGKKAAK